MHPKDKAKVHDDSNLESGGEPSSSSSAQLAAIAGAGAGNQIDNPNGRGRKSQKPQKVFFSHKNESEVNKSGSSTSSTIESNGGRPKRTTRNGYVDIGSNNLRRWTRLKSSYGYVTDYEFATFLLNGLHDDQPSESTASSSNPGTSTVDYKDEVDGEEEDEEDDDNDDDGDDTALVTDTGEDGNTDRSHDDSTEAVKKEPYDEEGYSGNDGANGGETDFSWDDDESDNSVQSDDDEDEEWTPASFICETQLKRQTSNRVDNGSPSQGLRRTRGRVKGASKRKKSPSARESTSEKKPKLSKCVDCNEKHNPGECPLLRPVHVVTDTVLPSHSDALVDYQRSLAELTLPHVLKFVTVEINHGFSVFAAEHISRYTQFGPLIGDRIKEADIREDADLRNIWEVFSTNMKLYMDTSNENGSNWLRYMRPAMSKKLMNVCIIAKNEDLYFVTIKHIEADEELVYWIEDSTWSWPKIQPVKMICGACNKRFSNPLYFRMHCVIFHDPNCGFGRRKFRCKVCGVAVLGRDALRQHAADMHGGKGAYQCEFCKKFLLRLHSVLLHQTYSCKLNPHRSRPLCEFCGKEFSFPQKLRVHMRRMHSNDSEILKEFECKLCSKMMSSPTSLQRHMNEVHAMNEVATCDRCGKTFQNKSNLKIHMLTHSGVKPFRCSENECTAAFTTKQCLQFHYKKAHGYTPENMPPIERAVAYTFENYSGEVSDGGEEIANGRVS